MQRLGSGKLDLKQVFFCAKDCVLGDAVPGVGAFFRYDMWLIELCIRRGMNTYLIAAAEIAWNSRKVVL